jgi:PhnB protein
MTETTLNPYLGFNGNAREAMEFYRDALGGSLYIQTFKESGQEMEGADGDRIMHAKLESGEITIMASDGPPGQTVDVGNNVSLSLQGPDKDGLSRIFDALAEGGSVSVPMAEQFWGDTFGMLTDRFGISWMVNVTKE